MPKSPEQSNAGWPGNVMDFDVVVSVPTRREGETAVRSQPEIRHVGVVVALKVHAREAVAGLVANLPSMKRQFPPFVSLGRFC